MYICEICGRQFSTKQSRGNHLSWHNRVVSEDTKSKMSKSKVGHKLSEETKSKISNSLKGHKVSEETRSKISKSNSSKTRTDEFKNRISSKLINHQVSDITKNKLRTSSKLRFSKPEEHQKLSESAKSRVLKYGLSNTFTKGVSSWYNDIYLRSRYEAIYLIYLLVNNIKFEYESVRLINDDSKIYISDFYLVDTNKIVEIKGYKSNKCDKIEQVFLGHGYDIEFIIGNDIWTYYDELYYSGINIDILFNNEFINKVKWKFINNKVILI